MSYILDALKKSEQERGNGSVPGVQTIHSSSVNYHQHKTVVWPWFLLVAVIINILVLVYFMQTRNSVEPAVLAETQPAANESIVAITRPQPANPIAPAAEESLPATGDAPIVENRPVEQPDILETPAPQAYEYAAFEALDLNDLPLNIRQQIPVMDFSAHVYSSNARQRSLVINGRFMEEGEQLSRDLTLVEITRDGAIFDFRGQLFRTSVLSGWN